MEKLKEIAVTVGKYIVCVIIVFILFDAPYELMHTYGGLENGIAVPIAFFFGLVLLGIWWIVSILHDIIYMIFELSSYIRCIEMKYLDGNDDIIYDADFEMLDEDEDPMSSNED